MSNQQLKALGLFSGTGQLELGFKLAGFDVVASNEVNSDAVKTLEANKAGFFGRDHQVLSDSIHTLSIEDLRKDYGPVDVIAGGFPCVTYSKAANIHGTRANVNYKKYDYERYAALGGDLFLHMARLIAGYQPRAFVFENVPSVTQAKIAIETFLNMPCNDKGNPLGFYYRIFGGILNAKDFGLPQDRPRFFFIGARRDFSLNVQRPISRRQLVLGDILERDAPTDLPEYVQKRLAGAYRDRPIITTAGPDAVAPCVVAHYAKDKGTRLIQLVREGGEKVLRSYTPREMARLQGIPDGFTLEGSESAQYVQAGNAVALPVAYAIARGVKEALVN